MSSAGAPKKAGRPVRLSLLGFGRVGREVFRQLSLRQAEIEKLCGRPVAVGHILVKDENEASPARAEIAKTGAGQPTAAGEDAVTIDIEEALDADIVVEVMGGAEPARRCETAPGSRHNGSSPASGPVTVENGAHYSFWMRSTD
ncbi:MAG: hypothetical protein ACM3X4_07310 [Ignavibacteriales bacterium]